MGILQGTAATVEYLGFGKHSCCTRTMQLRQIYWYSTVTILSGTYIHCTGKVIDNAALKGYLST